MGAEGPKEVLRTAYRRGQHTSPRLFENEDQQPKGQRLQANRPGPARQLTGGRQPTGLEPNQQPGGPSRPEPAATASSSQSSLPVRKPVRVLRARSEYRERQATGGSPGGWPPARLALPSAGPLARAGLPVRSGLAGGGGPVGWLAGRCRDAGGWLVCSFAGTPSQPSGHQRGPRRSAGRWRSPSSLVPRCWRLPVAGAPRWARRCWIGWLGGPVEGSGNFQEIRPTYLHGPRDCRPSQGQGQHGPSTHPDPRRSTS